MDAETTPTDGHPLTDEADLALGVVAARCEEVAGSIRIGRERSRGMSSDERTAFVRDAALALRRVEHFAAFAAHLFEGLLGERGVTTPRELTAATPPGRRIGRLTKLITALAALAGAGAGLWRAISGRH